MRELYNEFLHIPKHGKIREKVMLTRVAMTITIMVMCLAAMSITAYAYFSFDITSDSNTIKAANFDAQITVEDEHNVPVTPSSADGKKSVFKFANAGIYTVKLEKGSSTAEKGFCIVCIGNKEYYTAQIGVDVKRNLSDENDVVFELNVPSDTTMEILSHWGTSSYYGYEDKKTNGKVSYIESRNTTIDLTTSTTDVGEPQSNGEQDSTHITNSNDTTKLTENTPPETTEMGGETSSNESSTTTEPETQPTKLDPEATEPEETTETQPIDETTGETTTESNNEV